MKKFVLMMLPLLLMACGGGGNKEAGGKKATATEQTALPDSTVSYQEQTQAPQQAAPSNLVEQDFKEWITNRTQEPEGTYWRATCCSANYHVINGERIALFYTFQILETAQAYQHQAKYAGQFSFVDASWQRHTTPSFSLSSMMNKKVTIRWADGATSVLEPSKVESNQLFWTNPAAEKFQKLINEKGDFTVEVMTSSGQLLKYDFICSKRDIIDI